MATTRMSTKGQVIIPKAIRDGVRTQPGMEFDVTTDGRVITLTPKQPKANTLPRLTLQQLMDRRIPYDGPPITDALIREAAAEAAVNRYERAERSRSK